MPNQNPLSFLSDIQIPYIIYVALGFGILVILFFAFRFFTDNFLIIAILAIFAVPMILFGIFFYKAYNKGQDRKAYAVLSLFFIPLLINIPYVDAEVIPLDQVNSSRIDSDELEAMRIELKEELGVIKTDIKSIKESTAKLKTQENSDESNLNLDIIPIIVVQLISTAIIIFLNRNK